MTGWNNVVYRGEDTEILKNGTPYEVVGIIKKGENDAEYALKGIQGKFDSSLFQAPKGKRPTSTGVLKCSNPPAKGMILENLEVINDKGKLEPVLEEEVTAVHVIWGNVYGVHTKKGNAYIVRHCPDAESSTVSSEAITEAVDDNAEVDEKTTE